MARSRSVSIDILQLITELLSEMANNNKPNTRSNSSSKDEPMSVDDKLDKLLTEVNHIKNSNGECLREINKIKDEIKLFKNDITKSLDMCFDKIDKVEKSVKDNKGCIEVCEASIFNLQSENTLLKKTVAELKARVAAGEQYSRSNCLEITGVPEAKTENIFTVVKQVANALNFKLEDHMVDTVHRLARIPNKPNMPRGIILKFCRRVDMEEMRRRSKVKKFINSSELGYHSESRIYVNLSLTRETRLLWAEVRRFKVQRSYKFAWITSVGKIFLREKENVGAILITTVKDLEALK